MKSFFKSKYGPLVFSLLAGAAYFALALVLILESTGAKGILLGVFFCPAIVCGVAVVLLKSIKLQLEAENYGKIYAIAAVHIAVAAVAVVAVLLKLCA